MTMKLTIFLLFWTFAAFSTEIESDENLLESMQPIDEIVFLDLEANELVWKDPNNLIPTESKKDISFFLQYKDTESANRLFDSFYDFDVSSLPTSFAAELFNSLCEQVEVERRVSFLNQTPLILTTCLGPENAVSRLIERGANTKEVDDNGWMAVHFASHLGRTSLCKILLEKDAKGVNAQAKYALTTPLMLATRSKRVAVVKVLLAFGANPNIKDSDKETVLDYAPQNCADVIRKHIAKVDAIDKRDGCSSLHRAAKYGNVILCNLLLSHGANVDHQDIYGVTPLMLASINGFGELVTAFLHAGADSKIEDGKGNTAHKMALMEAPSCASLIADYEAKLKI